MELLTQPKPDSATPTHVTAHTESPAVIEPQVAEPPKKEVAHTRSRTKTDLTSSQLKQRLANVIVLARLKPTALPHESSVVYPSVTDHHQVNDVEYYQHDDLPLNRRGYKYKPCRPHANLGASLYLTTELAPYGVRTSYFDRSPGVACSQDMLAVTTPAGWLLARSNVGMREGTHYFEFDIVHGNTAGSKAHVRVGIGRREAALEAPVGFDGYGYGLRDVNGGKITLSRPRPFMASGFTSGDTLGMVVTLPLVEEQRRADAEFASQHKGKRRRGQMAVDDEERKLNMHRNVVRDQIPIKYKNGLYFEQFEYTRTKQMDHLLNPVQVFGEKAVLEKSDAAVAVPTIPHSRVEVYKNGEYMGTMFEDLYSFLPLNVDEDAAAADANTKQQQNPSYRNTDDGLLGYYPMMSVFQNGVVRLNPGPHFRFPPPAGATPLSARYDERVTEEWYWDLVDEVEAAYLDSFD